MARMKVLINANELELYAMNTRLLSRSGPSGSCSPRITRHGTIYCPSNTRACTSSCGGFESRYSRTPCLQVPESSLDIFEDVEPSLSEDDNDYDFFKESPPLQVLDSSATHISNAEWYNQSPADSCCSTEHRLSVFLLGDFDPEKEDYELNVRQQFLCKRRCSECHTRNVSPSAGDIFLTHYEAMSSAQTRVQTPMQLRSIDRAVGLVMNVKRLTSRMRSATVVPCKPDTPVPPAVKMDINTQRAPIKEPIRFVFEGPMPYARNCNLQLKPTMNHLRVPGRQPPNVPQTIMEEETMTPPTTPPSPAANDAHSSLLAITRRRKNASSWIAPPVIDVMVAHDSKHSKDMRVECPGVLVEHHN